MSKANIDGGGITGYIAEAVVALTPGSTVALDASLGGVFTLTPASAATINASNFQNGERVSVVVNTSGTTSYTVTFGTNFKSTATLATGTSDAKTFVVSFVGVGGKLVETSRTAAQ